MTSSNPKISTREKKTAARLAAVQALYEWKLTDKKVDKICDDFMNNRRGHEFEDETYIPFHKDLFKTIFIGVIGREADLDQAVRSFYKEDLGDRQLGKLFHLAMMAAAFELLHHDEIHENILISEYVALIDSLFHGQESKIGHAIMDKIAKQVRS